MSSLSLKISKDLRQRHFSVKSDKDVDKSEKSEKNVEKQTDNYANEQSTVYSFSLEDIEGLPERYHLDELESTIIVDLKGYNVVSMYELVSRILNCKEGIMHIMMIWDGDIAQLFIPSLLESPNNVFQASTEDDQIFIISRLDPMTHEQYFDKFDDLIGIQKAIALKLGLVVEDDKEDIHIKIDKETLAHLIEDNTNNSQLDLNHPSYQRLIKTWDSITKQVRDVRRNLQHLVPIEEGEKTYVQIIDVERNAVASYTHEHNGICLFSQGSFEINENGIIHVDPDSIEAELRHHLHELILRRNGELIGGHDFKEGGIHTFRNLGGYSMSSTTELIDDMRKLPEFYAMDIEQLEVIAGNYFADWLILSSQECFHIGDLDGHDASRHTLTKFIALLKTYYPDLSDEQLKLVDAEVFKFLSQIEYVNFVTIRWSLLSLAKEFNNLVDELGDQIRLITMIKESIDCGRPKEGDETIKHFVHAFRMFMRDAKQDDYVKLSRRIFAFCRAVQLMEDLVDSYSELAISGENALKKYKKIKKNKKQHTVQDAERYFLKKRIEFVNDNQDLLKDIRECFMEANPYISPDGREYPTFSSYALDPQNLFSAIRCKFPFKSS